MKTWWRQQRGLLLFLGLFGVMRLAIADWNVVPSGSMRPTLVEGDVVFYNRLAYDAKLPLTDTALARLGEPARGDVVIFSSPVDGVRLIKRVVGLPGDVVSLRAGHLVVNGRAADYHDEAVVDHEPLSELTSVQAVRYTESLLHHARSVQVMPQLGAVRDFGPVRVPADHYWMMGDSRDNSIDSRMYGPVARELLIGQALRVIVSGHVWPPELRVSRVGQPLSHRR
jgi:signal peptidase I